MKKKKFGIFILLLFLVVPMLLTFNAERIILSSSRYNDSSNENIIKPKSSQSNVVWERVNGTTFEESYYNAIWGDGTYWYTCGANDSGGAPDWDLLLTKWDSSGKELWSATYDGDGGSTIEQGTNVWGDGTYIYTCGLTNKDGTYDMLINKWYPDGTNIWSNTWGGPGYDAASSIEAMPGTSALLTCGHVTSGDADASLVQWNINTGNYVYDLPPPFVGDAYGDYYFSMIIDAPNIYLVGKNKTGSVSGSDLFLKKIVWGVGDAWEKKWDGGGEDGGGEIWLDGNNIYTSGFTEGGGGKDVLLVKWYDEGSWVSQTWNSTWGGGLDDQAYSVWGYGNYIYTTGYTYSYGNELLLMKWDKFGNLVWNSTWEDTTAPTPSLAYGTDLIGDANYVYTAGHSVLDAPMIYGQRRALIKWNANPEQLEWNLISPPESSVRESGTPINIELDSEFVVLESVFYHWDSALDQPWTELTPINLPSGDVDHTLHLLATTTTPYISDTESYTFTTDDTNPDVKIVKPETNEVWKDTPSYDLDITEPHIDEMWYKLNDGPKHYITSQVGEIDQSEWESLPDGDVRIEFFVRDTLGHEGDKAVLVRKDTSAEPNEFLIIIRNAVITAVIGGTIGIAFFLIKRKISKAKEKKAARTNT